MDSEEVIRERMRQSRLARGEPDPPEPEKVWDQELIPDFDEPEYGDDELDSAIKGIGIEGAYIKWCGKSVPNVGSRTEGIKISCPRPDHPDADPSAWINTEKNAWFCGVCQVGGDIYDIAAWRFGMPVPGYRSKALFPELRRRMAESLGVELPQRLVPGVGVTTTTTAAGAGRGVAAEGSSTVVEESDPYESWEPRDVGAAIRGEKVAVEPTVLQRSDGRCLMYSAQTNLIFGDPGTGKSWVALVVAAQEITAGRCVVWLDFEDSDETRVVSRLRDLGIPDERILEQFFYANPVCPHAPAAIARVVDFVTATNASLVVVDSVGEAFGLDGVNEDKDVEVAPWMRAVLRAIADAGPAVLAIDHRTKSRENNLFPSGSKRKTSTLSGAGYRLETETPFSRYRAGTVRIVCVKDRDGNFTRNEVAAVVRFDPDDPGRLVVTVAAPVPERSKTAVDAERIAKLVCAVIRLAKDAAEPMTGRELISRLSGSTEDKRAAIDVAARIGAIQIEPGARNAKMHTFVRELDDAERDSLIIR